MPLLPLIPLATTTARVIGKNNDYNKNKKKKKNK